MGTYSYFYSVIQVINSTDRKAKEVADFIVSYINDKLSSVDFICAELKLKRILEAQKIYPNDKVSL